MYTMQYKCAALLIQVDLSHEKVVGETKEAESIKILVICCDLMNKYQNILDNIYYFNIYKCLQLQTIK